jgi:glutathione-specific gamma-glutamylcyclotransferase
MGVAKLTRESLLDGTFHAAVRRTLGPNVRFMSDAERAAQIEAILGQAPRPRRVWVFAFGSLIWNPAFHFVERRTARIHGFHRQFCHQAAAAPSGPA